MFFTKQNQIPIETHNRFSQKRLTIRKMRDYPMGPSICAKWDFDVWRSLLPETMFAESKKMYEELSENYLGVTPYLLFLNEIPIGMFTLEERDSMRNIGGKLAHLWDVYIDVSYRGLGFGKHLIWEALREAKTLGFDYLLLNTLKPRLSKFYEKLDAKIIGEEYVNGRGLERLGFDLHVIDNSLKYKRPTFSVTI